VRGAQRGHGAIRAFTPAFDALWRLCPPYAPQRVRDTDGVLSFKTAPRGLDPEAGGVFMEERMFVSVTGLTRLALLAPVGMLFVVLSTGPSSAQASGVHAGKPAQVREVIGPAATVIATEHYQAEMEMSCAGDACVGSFPKPGNKRRQNITRMSCYILGSSGSTFRYGYAQLRSAGDEPILRQWLPVDHSSSTGNHILNRAVDMLVGSKQRIRVVFSLNGTAANATCTVSGTLDTLQ
jgi:hypothetical protein